MLIYHEQIDLEMGFHLLSVPKKMRQYNGSRISAASGLMLFLHHRHNLRCFNCGVQASCWVLNKGSKDKVGFPVLDLFAEKTGNLVLMTQDHIIPVSHGGGNMIENLRPACAICNFERGNNMHIDDWEFVKNNPHLLV